MKNNYTLALFFLLSIVSGFYHPINAQCPNYSPVNYFDTSCYRYLPADLKVGQGHLGSADLWGTTGARSFDFYIPAGREHWAMAVVHAWQVERNILKWNKDAFNWHSYFGTLLKESFGGCDPNLTMTGITRCPGGALVNPFINLDNYTISTTPGGPARVDGCFQIDHSTGWPIYPKYYPWRWTNPIQHTNFMAEDHFATAALSKMYYQLAWLRYMEYVKGYPIEDVLTNTGDNTAGTYVVAMSYNKGFYGTPENIFSTVANQNTAKASSDWLTLAFDVPDLNYDYTRAVGGVTKVLSNNYEGGWTRTWSGTGWTATADNAWHCWYDKPISWAIMTSYMNQFFPLYPEVNAATVTAKVKAKFDAINAGGPISFRYQLAPVLDVFILNMPYDDPMQSWLYSTDGISGCHKGSGCIGPNVTLVPKSATTFCSGLSVDLETIVGNGYTYQWYKNGTAIANPGPNQNIYTATTSGTYKVRVTTAGGCAVDSDCEILVTVVSCSSCSMTATASYTANACTGVQNGSVSVSLTNAAFPVSYNWTGPVSGNTATMSNVPDGTYTVEVTKDSDPTCKAYAMVTVVPTTVLYQQINTTNVTVNCNTANLSAQVVSAPPASCNYRIKLTYTGSDCYGTWDNSQLNIIATAGSNTLLLPAPRANGGNNCTHLDETVSVPNGVNLGIVLKRLPTWAITAPNFRIDVLNPAGTIVGTYNMNGVSINNPLNSVINVTTNCGVALPSYTMSWTPTTELTINTNTTNNTTAQAVVSVTRTYTVWAQHPTLAQCKMSKNLTVTYTCPAGLPVDWVYFDAEAGKQEVTLRWGTAQEMNNARFEIERSTDGQYFDKIGSIPGKRFSQSVSEYQYKDGLPIAGISYYRIKQMDYDGSVLYSETRMISLDGNSAYSVFPNPSNHTFNIHSITRQSAISVTLLDMTGRVLNESQIPLNDGNDVSFGEQLPSGVYILKIRDDQMEHTFKIIKQ